MTTETAPNGTSTAASAASRFTDRHQRPDVRVCCTTVSSPHKRLIGRPVDRMDHRMFGTTECADGARVDAVPRSGVDHGLMRSGELAGRAGVNAETLRYYERRGL